MVLRFPDVLFKRALAEERSGHFVEAVASYGELMTLTEPGTEYMRGLAAYESHDAKAIAAMRAQADRSLAILIRRVGDLDVSGPPGARITVDGYVASLRDRHVLVTAGRHVVTATIGARTESVLVECAAGQHKRIVLLGSNTRK